jgi:hypothetical protein
MAYHCIKNGSECDGCEDCKPKMPICPECGEECDTFYKHDDDIIGCEHCIREVESYDEI